MALATPQGYTALSEATAAEYLQTLPEVAQRLGGCAQDWQVREVGDGNLNWVFLVHGPHGSVCLKQSLPYVRLVGEGWPMPIERAFFEHQCMLEHGRHVGRLVPDIYHYDTQMFACVMECLSPHIIMRQGMIKAIRYPKFATDIAEYMACALFFTSDLYLPAGEKKQKVAVFCANTELCKITEDLIFTDPYRIHERNRWTSPQLDDSAAEIRNDGALKCAVSRLKLKFMTCTDALIHGDLHTGSLMVTEHDTRIIDHEFAFFGPMGFDIGAVLGNLLINYFSQDGHARDDDPRADYQEWVLATTEQVWTQFCARFLALWQAHPQGDAYPYDLFADAASKVALEQEQQRYMNALFADTLGFAGAKMIRRILGLAHNIDLEWITDAHARARCERRCLRLARDLIVNTERYSSIAELTQSARERRTDG